MSSDDPRETLARIRARADAATQGPWAHYGDGDYEVYDATEYSNGEQGPYVTSGCRDYDDAEFIAHARTDVPSLVAALRAVLDLADEADVRRSPFVYATDLRAAIDEHLGEDR